MINQAAYIDILQGSILDLKIHDYYVVMIFWNLFLLFLPFIFVRLLFVIRLERGFTSLFDKISGVILSFLWFIFVPNAAYVITDVRHLIDYCPAGNAEFNVCPENAWLIIFFFTYAVFGWVFLVYNIDKMREFIAAVSMRFAKIFPWLLIPFISLGVLLGLINRWNSWDIFESPFLILQSAAAYVSDGVYAFDWVVFTAGFYLLYFGGNKIFKTIKL